MSNLRGDSARLQVFFVYPYKDSEQLKPIFQKACSEAGVSAIFADEEIRLGENLAQKLHLLIVSSDIIVIAITESFSSWVSFEIAYSIATNKPILLFLHKKGTLPSDLQGFRFFQYETNRDLLHLLSSTLLEFKTQLKRPSYIQKRKEQKTLMEVLQDSLEKNVLVLGKDSDADGLEKMERISQVLCSKGYVPIFLKKLPEIRHLSLEEKMIRIGALCRFILVEDSRASGHIDEVRLCVECQYITATIREAGSASSWMQAHYPYTFNFINRFCYNITKETVTQDSLCENMSDSLETATEKAIEWAEKRIKDQKKYFGSHIYGNF